MADPERLMATSAPGVFVAGDGAGIGGADVAEQEGRLAGLGAAVHVGRLDPGQGARPGRAGAPPRSAASAVPADASGACSRRDRASTGW